MGEFVQHLGADDAPEGEDFQSSLTLLHVEKRVDQNVRVEEQAQRSFASSRSNL